MSTLPYRLYCPVRPFPPSITQLRHQILGYMVVALVKNMPRRCDPSWQQRTAVALVGYNIEAASGSSDQFSCVSTMVEAMFDKYELSLDTATIMQVVAPWEAQLRSQRLTQPLSQMMAEVERAADTGSPTLAGNHRARAFSIASLPVVLEFLDVVLAQFAKQVLQPASMVDVSSARGYVDWSKFTPMVNLVTSDDAWVFSVCVLERSRQVGPSAFGASFLYWVIEGMIRVSRLQEPALALMRAPEFQEWVCDQVAAGDVASYIRFATNAVAYVPMQLYGGVAPHKPEAKPVSEMKASVAERFRGRLPPTLIPPAGRSARGQVPELVVQTSRTRPPAPTSEPFDDLINYCSQVIAADEVAGLLKTIPAKFLSIASSGYGWTSTTDASTGYLNTMLSFFRLDTIGNPRIVVWTALLLHHFDLWSQRDFRLVFDFLVESYLYYNGELAKSPDGPPVRPVVPNAQFRLDVSFELIDVKPESTPPKVVAANLASFKTVLFMIYLVTRDTRQARMSAPERTVSAL
ncbi:hypothetical protein DICA3_F26588 [Diutina catenulata]